MFLVWWKTETQEACILTNRPENWQAVQMLNFCISKSPKILDI